MIGQRRGMSQIDAAQLNAHYCGGRYGWEKKKKKDEEKEVEQEEKKKRECNPEEGVGKKDSLIFTGGHPEGALRIWGPKRGLSGVNFWALFKNSSFIH